MKTAYIALAFLLTAGCGTYAGAAKPIAQAQVEADDGWIEAAPTPSVKQRDLADCGAAVLAMVAGRWHLPLTLDDAARSLPPPSKKGVRLGDLRDAARKHGLVAYAVQGDQAILEHELGAGRPVIVGLLRPYRGRRMLSHFEVVIALRRSSAATPGSAAKPSDEVEIVTIDPGHGGWQVRRWTELEAEWKPAGRPTLVVIGTRD